MYYLCQEDCVFTYVCLLVGWFVSSITQKLVKRFSQTWMEDGPLPFPTDLDKGTDPGIFSYVHYHVKHITYYNTYQSIQ